MTPIFALGPPEMTVRLILFAASQATTASALMLLQPRFLLENAVRGADVETARRQRVTSRDHGLDAVERGIDHGGRFDRVLMHLIPTQTPA